MYFRCADCLTATWTSVVRAGRIAPSIECGGCGRQYVPDPIEDLGTSMRTHYSHVMTFSKTKDLDMASAYAVLLGIMSIDQAMVLSQMGDPGPEPDKAVAEPVVAKPVVAKPAVAGPLPEKRATEQTEPAPEMTPQEDSPDQSKPPRGESFVPEVDPGFVPAIRAGHMTKVQAIERGNRKLFAARLVQRHGLSRRLAFLVADNRLSLGLARRRNEESRRSKILPTGVTRVQASLVGALALVALVALVWHFGWKAQAVERSSAPFATTSEPTEVEATPAVGHVEPTTRRAVLRASTDARRDEDGDLVEVSGPDPSSVLITYCDKVSDGPAMEPIELASMRAGIQDSRLGVFRNPASWDTLQMIRIRRDRQTGRWVAGDGKRPIFVAPLPDLPPDATRIPVRSR